jgi:hypothetical protein
MTCEPPELMTEDELLDHARQAIGRASVLPVGSLGRAVQWAIYDQYANELERRAIGFVVSLGELPGRYRRSGKKY